MIVLENGHVSEDALENYLLAQLHDSEELEVEGHIAVCSSCQERMEDLSQIVAAAHLAPEALDEIKAAIKSESRRGTIALKRPSSL